MKVDGLRDRPLTEPRDAVVGELEFQQVGCSFQAVDGGQLVPAQPQHLELGQVPAVHVRDGIFLDNTQDLSSNSFNTISSELKALLTQSHTKNTHTHTTTNTHAERL